MAPFEKHIFICINERSADNPKGSCSRSGGGELHTRFKKALYERGFKGRFRANKSGCLDACEHGCTVVVYPDNVWYGHVTVDDVDEIIDEHLLAGKPVQRLLAKFDK